MVRRRLVARRDIWEALRLSLKVAAIATLLALVLGTLAAAALSRAEVLRPRGDLAAVHPADRAARHHHRHLAALGLRHRWTSPSRSGPSSLGHATFCIVVVYNNVDRALPPPRRQPDRGVDGPRRQRLPDLPPRDPAARSPRRCSPAACSPSRCRSTRSSSRPSPPASRRPCRSGCCQRAGPAAPAPGDQRRRGVRHRW